MDDLDAQDCKKIDKSIKIFQNHENNLANTSNKQITISHKLIQYFNNTILDIKNELILSK